MGNQENSPSDHQQTWRRVAEDARHDLCYENAACGESFRNEISRKFDEIGPDSFKKKDFREVCWHNPDGDPAFQLQGKTVNGTLPDYLTRAVTVDELSNYLEKLVQKEGEAIIDSDKIASQIEDQTNNSEWLHLPDALGEQFAHLRVTLAHPFSQRVFATLDLDDYEPPDRNHTPGFWEEICDRIESSHEDWTHADLAAKCLARDPNPQEPKPKDSTYLLLYYDHSPVGSCRYPTPPDAEFFEYFRPVNPNEYDYGWTCPPIEGDDECDEDLAAPEVVHSNPSINTDRVWIRSIG